MGGHLSHLEREEHPEKLDASCGPIRGNVYRHDTKIVDGYLGIPYAKPPIGELRFKKPVPADIWTDTKNCTKYGPRCPQSGAFPEMIKFHKDDIPDEANCLNLNVFAPRWESDEFKTSGRPVMVYVHGGGFELSASRDYCDYSVSGVVPMSGNALCEFACRTCRNEAKACLEYIKHIGYKGSDDSQEILNWLKHKPIEEMDKLTGYQLPVTGYFIYQPNIDGDFLSKPLDELRKEAPKKSVMVGVAEHEGLFFSLTGDPRPADQILKEMICVSYKEDTGEKFEENRKKVYEFYAKNVDPNDEAKLKEKLVDFLGDTIFNGGTIACAQASVKYGNDVWFYVFDYVNPRGFGELEQVLPFVGPTHCTDLRYILGEGLYSEFKPDDADWEMIETMTTMYANFAKYGNPNGKNGLSHWEPYTMDHPERHYRIAYPRGEMREEYHKGRWEFIKMIRDNNKNLEEVVYGR
ncbi:Protein CBG10352 [Caenorhabditis briggsae]|uniref:Protein CBG10352 n=1 Tax=Caenorhabditis briggsae TaxID=6238 RepID=A8XB07_CAEBR|nr:Protein CBG10352 [Caenorhabditis briggsae]CAP29787.2 Protein CBG10352 [Caenorhabditis briggsae]